MCTKSPFAVASAGLLYVKCEQTVSMGMWKVPSLLLTGGRWVIFTFAGRL